ncbi:MAG: hypothetical protein ACI8RD_004889 [Bacillariaceae sp.]|jgi:hypothetical protein
MLCKNQVGGATFCRRMQLPRKDTCIFLVHASIEVASDISDLSEGIWIYDPNRPLSFYYCILNTFKNIHIIFFHYFKD